MPIDIAGFVGAVRQHELIPPGALRELVAQQGQFAEVRSLAQHVVGKRWLTPFQVNQICAGHAGQLVLGQYRILERIGEGGMGQVFKARHRAMDRIVALKVIRKDRLENERAIKRFHREIQIAAKLHHPNIVMAYDADTAGGVHFIAMEFVEGVDLAHLAKEKGPLPIPVACDYVCQAALGLQYAHERGLVHRDIKPSNLLVAKASGNHAAGVVKVLDLGLARLTLDDDEATGTSLSAEGSVLGTPDYMAPEQAKDARAVDARADVYSLGCTLYFLLTGQVPFPGGSNIEKLLRHQTDDPRPLENLRRDVPSALRTVVRGLMAKRVEDRIPTARAAAEALAPFCGGAVNLPTEMPRKSSALRGASMTASLVSGVLPSRPGSRRRLLVAAVVVGLVVLGGLIALLSSGGSSASGKPTGPVAVASGTGKPTRPPAGPVHAPLTHYLPEAVDYLWVYKVREVVQSGLFQQHETQVRQSLNALYTALLAYGIDLFRHVDRAAMLNRLTDNPREPIFFWVFQGSFDRAKFDQAMKDVLPRPAARPVPDVANGVNYQYAPLPGAKRSTFVALIGSDTLIYTNEEKYAIRAWGKGAGRQGQLADKEIQRRLENLDNEPDVLLLVGGSFSLPGQQQLSTEGIRLFTCGFRISNDLAAEYTLVARDAATARSLQPKAPAFFEGYLQFLGDNGFLGRPLKRAAATLDERTSTVTIQARYNGPEVAGFFNRKP